MALNYTSFSRDMIDKLTNGGSMSFPQPYIGLFTTMPGANGSGGEELSYPEYKRVKLNTKGIEGNDIMGDPTSETGSGDDAGKTIAVIKNQEYIYFPVNETGSTQTAVGFGLFTTVSGGQPYLWATFATSKPVGQNSVPTFLKDDLMLKAK